MKENLLRMRSRTIAIAALLNLLLAGAAPAQVPDGSTIYETSRLKAAFVIEPRKAGAFEYIQIGATVRRDLNTGEIIESASAGLGHCQRHGCFATLKSYEVIVFELDPALTSGRLVVQRGPHRHHLSFRTSFPSAVPPVYQNPNLCGGTTTTVAIHNRNAYAEGRVFGRRVATGSDANPDLDMAERMEQHLDVEECD